MKKIDCYKFALTTEYESRGFYYKGDSEDNFPNSYCDQGGGYVRRERAVLCSVAEATHIRFSTMTAQTYNFVGEKPNTGRYQDDVELRLYPSLKKWLVTFSLQTGRNPSLADIQKFVLENRHHRGIPKILLGAIKAQAEYALQKHGICDYTLQFHNPLLLELIKVPSFYV